MLTFVTQLNTDVFSHCSSAGKKFKTQEDFVDDTGDVDWKEYEEYFTEHVKPGSTVRCREAYDGVYKGETGRVLEVLEFNTLFIEVDWERRGVDFGWWLCGDLDLVE